MPTTFTLNSRVRNLFVGYHRNLQQTINVIVPVSIVLLISKHTIETECIEIIKLSLLKFFHLYTNPCTQMSAADECFFKIRKYIDFMVIYFASKPIKLSLKKHQYTINDNTYQIKTKHDNNWIYQANEEWTKIYTKFEMIKLSDCSKIYGNFKIIIFSNFDNTTQQCKDACINIEFQEDFIITPFEIVTIKCGFINSSCKDIQIIT